MAVAIIVPAGVSGGPYQVIGLTSGGGGASVTADVVGTPKYQATSNSFSYTGLTITGGLTKPALVCVLARVHASNDVEAGVAVTWGGTPLTLIFKQNASATTRTVFFFGLLNPASGNQTLAVSGTNVATDNFVNCVSFSNVNTSFAAAFPNTAGAQNGSSIAVTSSAGHIGVGMGLNGATNGTILGTTVISDNTSGLIVNCIADYVASSGATVTVGTSTSQSPIGGIDISN